MNSAVRTCDVVPHMHRRPARRERKTSLRDHRLEVLKVSVFGEGTEQQQILFGEGKTTSTSLLAERNATPRTAGRSRKSKTNVWSPVCVTPAAAYEDLKHAPQRWAP